VDATDAADPGEDLMRRADVAMYLAKRAGGGVSVYDRAVDAASQEQARRLRELQHVLSADASPEERRQLVVHYQPQTDIRTGEVLGAEALVRWNHPRLGLLGPSEFLDLVEDHNLMIELTGLVLRDATAHRRRWRDNGHPLRISVNLSPSCLSSPALLPLVDDVLATADVMPADLTLEITETSLMDDEARAMATANELAGRGVTVSLDDYGTGFSSLAHLNDLPARELKLDRSFTARLVTDRRTAAIVAGVVELAHRLGLRVVAEGVEDHAELDALRELDCDEVQGFLCGVPMPVAEFDRWLEQPAGRYAASNAAS
jgi:EAL domain-containing protein (putative c-di-GMP-specific phosphodiesterase class I)